MSPTLEEQIQEHADAILRLLALRLKAGQLVIHYADHHVQGQEVNHIFRPLKERRPLRRDD